MTVVVASIVAITVPAAFAHDGEHPADSGWFQKCGQTAIGVYDPIVYSDQPPPVEGGHRHLFFGGDVRYDSTFDQLRAGGTTCTFRYEQGDNKGGYWVPDLFLRDGTWAKAVQVNVYYRKGPNVAAHDVVPFPDGLKMVIHDRNNDNTDQRWFCGDTEEGSNQQPMPRPYDCNPNGDYPYVAASIKFPQCGDGRKNSQDHISHMVYARADGCPADHPYVHPQLEIKVKYATWKGEGSNLAGGEDPATGFHADYFEAWNRTQLQNLINNCIYAGRNCFQNPPLQ